MDSTISCSVIIMNNITRDKLLQDKNFQGAPSAEIRAIIPTLFIMNSFTNRRNSFSGFRLLIFTSSL